jgi:acetyl-CoA acetyltransferase
MMPISNQTAVTSAAFSDVGRHLDVPLGALAIEATIRTVERAGLELTDIDGISTYPYPSNINAGAGDGVELVSVEYLAKNAPLPNLRWSCSITAGTVTAAFVQAVHAVAAGACNYALVYRAMHSPKGKFGVANIPKARGAAEFSAPYGLGNVVLGSALAFSAYLGKYGRSREEMAPFIENNRRNASINPDAVFFGKPISQQDYLDARVIADPVCMLDCDMPVDGVGALIVTTAQRARDLRLPPAYVKGCAALGLSYATSIPAPVEGYRHSAGMIADALWSNAGIGPSEVDHVNLYDGFSYFVPLQLEAFGFCSEGEALDLLQDDTTHIGGKLPLNTSGGALGMGRLHGTPQLIEAVLQLQGEAGERQVDCSVSLVHTGSPQSGSGAAVLTNVS